LTRPLIVTNLLSIFPAIERTTMRSSAFRTILSFRFSELNSEFRLVSIDLIGVSPLLSKVFLKIFIE
jgi:hypothetical protein